MALAVAPVAPDGTTQAVFYDQGVGTGNLLDRLSGGAFGSGLDLNIQDAYRFLMNNYDAGDDIFFFGFSRGAYTVRSTAGFIRKSGLLHKVHAGMLQDAYRFYRDRNIHPDHEEAQGFRRAYSREPEVHFMGVWDTVGSLGIPVRGLRFLTRRKYEFHDTELSKIVKHAYHAVAIDEKREPFTPTLWSAKPKGGQFVAQVWFSGVHSDVGGGQPERGLADVAFTWIAGKARAGGLVFSREYLDTFIHADEMGTLHNSMTGFYRITPPKVRTIGDPKYSNQSVCESAVQRRASDETYHPKNLEDYLSRPDPKISKLNGP
jgi:uncharacterized protein (DUF2235 family)